MGVFFRSPAATLNEPRCQAGVLQECNASRTGFSVLEQCTSAALCDAAAGACGAATCTPNQRRCRGAALERCNPEGTGFELLEQCASAALCDADQEACNAPTCVPRER